MTTYEIGKPMPGAYPTAEGVVMEIEPAGGLVLMIQMPGLTAREAKAFKNLRRYYFLETGDAAPVAHWTFEFDAPMQSIEANLDARLYDVPRVEGWLDTSQGVKNALHLYLLDGPTLRAQKLLGLRHEAVAAFHATLRKQLATPYARADYLRTLRGIEQFSAAEIKKMATKFEK